MNRRPLRLALFVLAAACGFAGVAHADIYLCRDANGVLNSSDRLTADCLRYGGKVLGPNGTVRRVILSPQEQQQAEREAQLRQQQQRQALARQREDRALLLRYPNPAALEQARENDLATPKGMIAQAEQSLQRLQRERKQLEQEAQFYPKGPLPLNLRTKFEENRALTEQEQALIANQKLEIDRINRHYDALKSRMGPLWEQARLSVSGAGRAH